MTSENAGAAAEKPKRAASKFSVWGLVEAFAACLVACTLTGFAAEMHWLLELTCHFRVQYLVLLIAMAGTLAMGRRFKFATVCLACSVSNAVVVAPWLVPDSKAKPAGQSFRVMVLNVHTENTRHDLVLAEVRRVQPDVVFLMEVDSKWEQGLQGLSTTFPHRVFVAREDNFGIALFSRHPLKSPEVVEWAGEFGVPSVVAVVEVLEQPLFVIGTHPLPPANRENAALRNEQLEKIAGVVAAQKLPALVLGDLNATPWSPCFRKLEQSASLRDTGRRSGWHPTWPAVLPPLWIPLDHCLVTREFPYASRTIGNYVGSDHYPVIVNLVLPVR